MSCHSSLVIYCDVKDCYWDDESALGVDQSMGMTAAEARAQLAEGGWVNEGARDYCPRHAEEADR